MKRSLLVLSACTAMAAGMILTSCRGKELPVPVDYTINGPATVFQTEEADYEVILPWEQPGTTWSWSVAGATLQSVSSDTKIATFKFSQVPANDTAYITVGQKTAEGVKGDDTVVKVKVKPFCIFNINNFTGAFDCDEAGYGIYAVNLTKDPVLANTIVNDNFWDWPGPGAVVKYTLSGDFLEKVTVSRQNFEFGDGYDGWVEGSGLYNSCAGTMEVDYTVYYDGEEYDVNQKFSAGTKGSINTVVRKKSSGNIR
jgi:hypothetical protein